MKKLLLFLLFVCNCFTPKAQDKSYLDSIIGFRDNYVINHEVVLGKHKRKFRFYPVSEAYRVNAAFEKVSDTIGFIMKTSGTKDKKYFRYGRLTFRLQQSLHQLTVYQSEQLMQDSTYRNYLFLPFTDGTSGLSSYGGGRYIDFQVSDVINNSLLIDFNKAYNPYCAYTTGYNCPIPPRENHLTTKVVAGEKAFKGKIKSRK